MNLKKQNGFTLIELIMVIVILGILAATALPKFANMQVDARVAALKGAHGAINSAIQVTHAEALLKNATGATGTITLEGQTINMVYGYPAATAAGIGAAITLTGDISFTTPGSVIGFAAGVVTTPASCQITYTAATSTLPATAAISSSDCS